jgi:hypothetical protein
MEVLGQEATVKLRQFELLLQFAERQPEVEHALFNNAHKFVPQITVGQTEGSAVLIARGQIEDGIEDRHRWSQRHCVSGGVSTTDEFTRRGYRTERWSSLASVSVCR